MNKKIKVQLEPADDIQRACDADLARDPLYEVWRETVTVGRAMGDEVRVPIRYDLADDYEWKKYWEGHGKNPITDLDEKAEIRIKE